MTCTEPCTEKRSWPDRVCGLASFFTLKARAYGDSAATIVSAKINAKLRCRTPKAHPLLIALMFIADASLGLADPPPVDRQAQLLHLLRHDCGSCHGLTMRGGLGPALSPQALAGKNDQVLTGIVLEGVPGTPMPPWRFELSRDEAAWMIARLKTGVEP